MSAIADALKKAKEVDFLVDVDFDGLIKRLAMKDISVPDSGAGKKFKAAILNYLNIGTSFSLDTQKYSVGNVPINIANKERLQDEEVRRRLDRGIGKIYIWCDGLSWSDIENNGLIFSGVVRTEQHNHKIFSFRLEEQAKRKLMRVPGMFINADTWPAHRTEGGAGSVAGLPQPLLLGDWPKGIPLRCVNTSSYIYLAHIGAAKSTDADYSATVENVYDKDGAVIASANYTFYPDHIDNQGNPVTIFDFSSDQSASEPLSCSIRGLYDGSGEYTGTEGAIIEHPAHIFHFVADQYSTSAAGEIDIQSIKTMKSLLPGFKFATLVNSPVEGIDLVDKILYQCQCARIPRPGGIGVMTFDTDAIEVARINDFQLTSRPQFTKTPPGMICNNLKVAYAQNRTTGNYEGELYRDRSNNDICRKSYLQYEEQPQRELKLPDVQEQATAEACTKRYLSLHAFRHDIVTIAVPYWVGLDIREGDAALLTLEDGPSRDGAGWVNERCILLDRKFGKSAITQRFWKVNVD